MRTPPLLADFNHARPCKLFLRKILDTTIPNNVLPIPRSIHTGNAVQRTKTSRQLGGRFPLYKEPQAKPVGKRRSGSDEAENKDLLLLKVSTGNANRTKKQKEVSPNGREELITHEMGMSISHSNLSEIEKKSDIWEIAKRHRKNTEDAV